MLATLARKKINDNEKKRKAEINQSHKHTPIPQTCLSPATNEANDSKSGVRRNHTRLSPVPSFCGVVEPIPDTNDMNDNRRLEEVTYGSGNYMGEEQQPEQPLHPVFSSSKTNHNNNSGMLLFQAMIRIPWPFLCIMPTVFVILIAVGWTRDEIVEEYVGNLWIPTSGEFYDDSQYVFDLGGQDFSNTAFLAMAFSPNEDNNNNNNNNNLFTSTRLEEIRQRMEQVEATTVTYKGNTYTWDDVCMDNSISRDTNYLFPCVRLSPMDLFQEANWFFNDVDKVTWYQNIIQTNLIQPYISRLGILQQMCATTTTTTTTAATTTIATATTNNTTVTNTTSETTPTTKTTNTTNNETTTITNNTNTNNGTTTTTNDTNTNNETTTTANNTNTNNEITTTINNITNTTNDETITTTTNNTTTNNDERRTQTTTNMENSSNNNKDATTTTTSRPCDHQVRLRTDEAYAVLHGYPPEYSQPVGLISDVASLEFNDPCRICVEEEYDATITQLHEELIPKFFMFLAFELNKAALKTTITTVETTTHNNTSGNIFNYTTRYQEKEEETIEMLRDLEQKATELAGTGSIAKEDVEEFFLYYVIRSLYSELGAEPYFNMYHDLTNSPLSMLCGQGDVQCPPTNITMEDARATLLRHADNAFSSRSTAGAPFPMWSSSDGGRRQSLFAGDYPVSGSGINMNASLFSILDYFDIPNAFTPDWNPMYDNVIDTSDELWISMVERNPIYAWFMAGLEPMTSHCGNDNLPSSNTGNLFVDLMVESSVEGFSQKWCTDYSVPYRNDETYTRQHFAKLWYDLLLDSESFLNITQGTSDPYTWTLGLGCGYTLGGQRDPYRGRSEQSILQSASRGELYYIDEGTSLGAIDRSLLMGDVVPPIGRYDYTTNPLEHVGVIQTIYPALTGRGIVQRVQNCNRPGTGPITGITEQDGNEILKLWKEAFEYSWTMKKDNTNQTDNVQFVGFFDDLGVVGTSGRFLRDITLTNGRLTAISIIVIAIFSIIFLFSPNPVESRVFITVIGVLLIIIAYFAALGLTLLLGIKQNMAIAWTLPFIILGIGVDDMYIVLMALQKQIDYSEDSFLNAMKEVVVPVTITSLVNASMFAIMSISNIPAVVLTAQAALVCIIFLYFVIIICFPAYCYLDMRRQASNKYDVVFCFTAAISTENNNGVVNHNSIQNDDDDDDDNNNHQDITVFTDEEKNVANSTGDNYVNHNNNQNDDDADDRDISVFTDEENNVVISTGDNDVNNNNNQNNNDNHRHNDGDIIAATGEEKNVANSNVDGDDNVNNNNQNDGDDILVATDEEKKVANNNNKNGGVEEDHAFEKNNNGSERSNSVGTFLAGVMYHRFFKPLLLGKERKRRSIMHTLIFVITITLFILGIYGITVRKVGLGLEGFFPADHQAGIWARMRTEELASWSIAMNWGELNYTDPDTQMRVMKQFEDIIATPHVAEVDTKYLWIATLALWTTRQCGDNVVRADSNIYECGMDQMYNDENDRCSGTWKLNTYGLKEKLFATPGNNDTCQAFQGGICRPTSQMHVQDLIDLGVIPDNVTAPGPEYVDEVWCPVFEGWSNEKMQFCVQRWRNLTGGSGGLILDDGHGTPSQTCSGVYYDDESIRVPIPYSVGPMMFGIHLYSHEDTLDLIRETREICDDDPVVHCWMTGIPYNFWSQYLEVFGVLIQIGGLAIGIALVVSFLLLFTVLNSDGHHPTGKIVGSSIIGSLLIGLTNILSIVTVSGLSVLAGVNLTGFSVMSFVLSVAFSVEYAVHIVSRWLRADMSIVSSLDRVDHTVSFLMLPTFMSFISSLVGVVCLAFTEFTFSQVFFFRPLIIVMFVTYFYGCYWLPVTLTYFDFDIVKAGKVTIMESDSPKLLTDDEHEL